MASFATYAVGFVARPLGGLMFGHYGEKFGRRSILVTTLFWQASFSPPPLQVVSIPAFASLSDRVGRRPVYLAGALFLGLFAVPFFWSVDSGAPVLGPCLYRNEVSD